MPFYLCKCITIQYKNKFFGKSYSKNTFYFFKNNSMKYNRTFLFLINNLIEKKDHDKISKIQKIENFTSIYLEDLKKEILVKIWRIPFIIYLFLMPFLFWQFINLNQKLFPFFLTHSNKILRDLMKEI